MLGAVHQIHNFGLSSESNGEPQQGFKMQWGVAALADLHVDKMSVAAV